MLREGSEAYAGDSATQSELLTPGSDISSPQTLKQHEVACSDPWLVIAVRINAGHGLVEPRVGRINQRSARAKDLEQSESYSS